MSEVKYFLMDVNTRLFVKNLEITYDEYEQSSIDTIEFGSAAEALYNKLYFTEYEYVMRELIQARDLGMVNLTVIPDYFIQGGFELQLQCNDLVNQNKDLSASNEQLKKKIDWLKERLNYVAYGNGVAFIPSKTYEDLLTNKFKEIRERTVSFDCGKHFAMYMDTDDWHFIFETCTDPALFQEFIKGSVKKSLSQEESNTEACRNYVDTDQRGPLEKIHSMLSTLEHLQTSTRDALAKCLLDVNVPSYHKELLAFYSLKIIDAKVTMESLQNVLCDPKLHELISVYTSSTPKEESNNE